MPFCGICSVIMLKKLYNANFIFLLTLLFVIFSTIPYVSAKEAPKLKSQNWQINGIVAALDDGYVEVQQQGFWKIREYELKNLDKQKAQNIAYKAVKLLKDKNVNPIVRSSTVDALGNLGDAAQPYVKDIVEVFKDKNVDPVVRSSSVYALGNLGNTAKPYVKDIVEILKDKNVDSSVRSSAVEALKNLGNVAKPYVKDIADILKDKNIDLSVRFLAASALGNLGDAAKPYVQYFLNIFKDKNVEPYIRASTLR